MKCLAKIFILFFFTPILSLGQEKAVIVLKDFGGDSLGIRLNNRVLLTVYNDITNQKSFYLNVKKPILELQMLQARLVNFTKVENTSQTNIYVFPGDSIIVNPTKEGYEFEGNRAEEWNFMASLAKTGYPLMGWSEWNFGFPSYDQCLTQSLSKKGKIMGVIAEKERQLNFSPDFVRLLKRDIESAFLKSFTRNLRKFRKTIPEVEKEIVDFVKSYEVFFQSDFTRNSYAFEYGLMDWSCFMARAATNFRDPVKTKSFNDFTGFDSAENFDLRLEMAKELAEPMRSEIMYKLISYRFRTNSWESDFKPYVIMFNEVSENPMLLEKINSLAGKAMIPPKKDF